MIDAKIITCTRWFIFHNENWNYNHLEIGHSTNLKPTPKFASQNSWLKSDWKKEHCLLTSDQPPKVIKIEELHHE